MRPRYDVCSSFNTVIVPFRIWLILCPRQKPWAVFHRSPGSLVLAVHLLLMNVTWWTVLEWSLQWRHHDHDGFSNHQPHRCLLNRLFRRRSKKSSKLRVTGLCVGNSPRTGEFPAQMASNAENVSIWWRHHGYFLSYSLKYHQNWSRSYAPHSTVMFDERGLS